MLKIFRGDCADDSQTAPSARRAHLRLRSAPLAAALAAVIAVPSAFLSRDSSEWTVCYLKAAREMVAGRPINVRGGMYSYPPCMAWLTTPLAALPDNGAMLVWALINTAALLVLVGCSWRLIGGPKLRDLPPAWSAVFWLGLLLMLRWTMAPLGLQQFDVVIAALIAAGCLALVRGHELRGGMWIGMAAAMKFTPLLFAPYFLWRGRWKAALCVGGVATAMNVLPDVCFPKQEAGYYIADWWRSFASHVQGWAPGQWFTAMMLNQSLAGLFNRLGRMVTDPSAANLDAVKLSVDAAFWVKRLTYGTGLTLAGITVLFAWRPLRSPAGVDRAGNADTVGRRWSAEFGAVMALMLLLSPMSGKAHYVLLWLPTLLVAQALIERPTAWRKLHFVVLLVCGSLTAKGITGKALGDWTLNWGLPTCYALATLGAMWGLMLQARREQALAEAAPESDGADHTTGILKGPHFLKMRDRAEQTERRRAA